MTQRGERIRRPAAAVALPLAGLLLALVGCGPPHIDASYGKRRGSGEQSVNGTSVLAEMFRQRGFQTYTWRRISPRLNDYDVVIWTPDDFAPPSAEERAALERWLERGGTLVYVGRDYDALPSYWSQALATAPPEQVTEITRRLAKAKASYRTARLESPRANFARWFTQRREPPRRADELNGRWLQGIDADALDLQVGTRLDRPRPSDLKLSTPAPPRTRIGRSRDDDDDTESRARQERLPDRHEVLLGSGSDPLVFRVRDSHWGKGQLIVVNNGSFLLNLPLVNHEHRKLAGKLIAECGSPGKAVFLESSAGGPPVYDTEPSAKLPTGLEIFSTWPIGFILLHAILLGALVCIALFPIFGRPRALPPDSRSDFGKHIAALGKLLQRTRDPAYVISRLQHYQQMVRRDSGRSHAEPRLEVAAAAAPPVNTTQQD